MENKEYPKLQSVIINTVGAHASDGLLGLSDVLYANIVDLIEKEIHSRIEFKMSEFNSVIKNKLAYKHRQAFDMTKRSNDVWEAFQEVSEALQKEIIMPPPYNEMANQRFREKRDRAVNELMNRFHRRGSNQNYQADASFIVSIIEKI